MQISKSNLYTQFVNFTKRKDDFKGPGYDVGTYQTMALLNTDYVEVVKLTITAQDETVASVYIPLVDLPKAIDSLPRDSQFKPLKVEIDYGTVGEQH